MLDLRYCNITPLGVRVGIVEAAVEYAGVVAEV